MARIEMERAVGLTQAYLQHQQPPGEALGVLAPAHGFSVALGRGAHTFAVYWWQGILAHPTLAIECVSARVGDDVEYYLLLEDRKKGRGAFINVRHLGADVNGQAYDTSTMHHRPMPADDPRAVEAEKAMAEYRR